MRKVSFIILLLFFGFVNYQSFALETHDSNAEQSNVETEEVYELDADFDDDDDKKIMEMVEREEQERELYERSKKETIEEKIKKYEKSLKDKTVTAYINVGGGTTGGYIQASAYYLNVIGVKVEYSYFPYVNLAEKLAPLLNDSRISTFSIENKHSFGIDFSFRPFALLTKKLAGFRIDLGLRYFRGKIEIGAGSYFDILGEIEKSISGPGINSDNVLLVIKNFFSLHGVPKDIWEGDAVMKFPISLATDFKPYVGIGWDINLFKGFNISLSVGIISTQWKVEKTELFYKDQPIESYRKTMVDYFREKRIEGLVTQELLNYFDNVIDGVLNDNTRNIENMVYGLQIKDFKISHVWPVVQIGFGWQFDL